MATSQCSRCRIPLVPQRCRDVPIGHRRHIAHGLCVSCYSIAKARRRYVQGRRGTGRPSLDFDWVVVIRLVDGTYTGEPTYGELDQAIGWLTRRGESARTIAIRLGCTLRTVQRHRAAHRQAVAA